MSDIKPSVATGQLSSSRRQFLQATASVAAFAVAGHVLLDEAAAVTTEVSPPDGHFHAKGKPPSKHTLKIFEDALKTLPFDDNRDIEEHDKGLIAPMRDLKIMADAGHVAWDLERYQFLLESEEFDAIHPSLVRQSKLNMNYGLYEVIPGIYQVRGFDLSDISFIRGKKGWIVFDPLVSPEVARAALNLFQKHVGKGDPITTVIYSHSHADHWGGVRGIVNEDDVLSGKVEIIAPRDFMEHTISENIYAGNAMNRRLYYQYALLLPANPYGHAGQGLGQNVSIGNTGLIAPTRIIEKDIDELTVDGVSMVFQNTPDTEAPSEMNTYFPEMKALWMAENVTSNLHNIYTLRGAPVRDALRWSKYINESLYMFGLEAEVMFASHHWPRWGNERIQAILRDQRDLYANMNNQSLHLANQGVTINEIHNIYELPESLKKQWHARGYHGSPEHNSRAVVNRYLGYWDCNPSTLISHSPSDSAPLYVEMMGGASKIISKGQKLYDQGEYLLAQEILNKLVLAEPSNQKAKDLLADIFEQLGYQQENPGIRNSYLAGAFELRSGIPEGKSAKTAGADVIRSMSTELFLNFLGIKMDSRKAEGLEFTINLITPDNDEKYIVEMSNATLTNIKGYLSEEPDLTITINRSDLEKTMMGTKSMDAQINDGSARITGDRSVIEKLASTMVDFDPQFEIMPGTKVAATTVEKSDPYNAITGETIAE